MCARAGEREREIERERVEEGSERDPKDNIERLGKRKGSKGITRGKERERDIEKEKDRGVCVCVCVPEREREREREREWERVRERGKESGERVGEWGDGERERVSLFVCVYVCERGEYKIHIFTLLLCV